METLRRPRAIRLSLVCALVVLFIVLSFTYPARAENPRLQGPESSSACSTDAECALPPLGEGQVGECVKSRCRNGDCTIEFLTGKSLGRYKLPSPLSCYEEPVVCDNAGKEATLSDPSKRVAAHEDELCLPSQPISNPCQAARCRNKECISTAHPNERNVECESPYPAAGACQKGVCRDGSCKPAPDAKKQGALCLPDETKECRTTKHHCSSTGSCDPKTTIEDGKECSPDPDGSGPEKVLLASPASLPPSFLALFQGSLRPPAYNCDSTTCSLQYCGDGKVNRPNEDCDGAAYAEGIARNLPCNMETCKVGTVTAVESCSMQSFNPPAPDSVRILSEDFLICGSKGPRQCEDMLPAAEARKAELLKQGYSAIVTGGYATCNPWNNNPCLGAEPARWTLHEARVCYYSQCGDGKLTPNEECDGTLFKDGVAAGSSCDPKSCTVIPPVDDLSCGDLSLSATGTLNRQWGIFDVSIALQNNTSREFKGHTGVAYIVIDQPQGLTSQFGSNTGSTWYNPANWSCANLKTDPDSGLLINPEGKKSTSAYGCFKFYPDDAKKLLDSGSALRDDNNPDFLIANSSLTSVSFEGATHPAVRLDSIPSISSKAKWTATTNAKLADPMRVPDIANSFSGRLICKPLSVCGDGKKDPSEQCDGNVPPGTVAGASCNGKCVIEFCGDGIVNRDEECDGSARKPGTPQSALCDQSTCKIHKERECVWVAAWATTTQQWMHESLQGRYIDFTKKYADQGERKDIPGCFAQGLGKRCGFKNNSFVESPGSVAWRNDKGVSVVSWCYDPELKIETHDGPTAEWGYDPLDAYELARFLQVPPDVVELMEKKYEYQHCTNRSCMNLNSNSFIPAIDWFMDKNCRYVAPDLAKESRVCGFAGASWSPISLLLSEDTTLEQNNTVTSFALDPRLPATFSLWKASEKAPLLVYDPEHKGVITSARQLFGNYTFGGRTTNLSDDVSSALRAPWSNGYEALGLLDTNDDGSVSGDELKPIALWLDKNRDGISDGGEVVSAQAFGITRLSYKDPRSVPNSKDFDLASGFTRVVDGTEVIGRSVDWFGETFTNQLEATQALEAKLRSSATNTSAGVLLSSLPEELRGNPFKFKPHRATDHTSDLSGYWLWFTEDEAGQRHPGILALEQKGDRVFGYNIIEAILSDNEHGLGSSMKIIPAVGEVSVSPQGERTLSMKLFDPSGEVSAESSAELTATGNSLRGKTKQEIKGQNADDSGKPPPSASTTYGWRAIKFASKPPEK